MKKLRPKIILLFEWIMIANWWVFITNFFGSLSAEKCQLKNWYPTKNSISSINSKQRLTSCFASSLSWYLYSWKNNLLCTFFFSFIFWLRYSFRMKKIVVDTDYYTFIFVFQLCVILEPMQELMSRHKAYSMNPRDCLKTTLFQKWQRTFSPSGNLILY